jgi:GT2 family glycosyltransferase
MMPPTVSVIIPTHNRRASAQRALHALSAQSYPRAALDIIVVADGCTDGTAELATAGWPIAVRVTDQPHAGPANARNRGAAAARGDLLIFLDDDIEVVPGFVAAHAELHAAPDTVVIGYLPPHLQGRRDFFAVMLRAWWEAMFERMRDPGHRFGYSDLLSGNFSISRLLFDRAGGFDEELRCHEDYELGYRLIGAGARFRFAPAAAGWHHEHTDLARALRRKRDEGRADVALARRYPELAPVLPLSREDTHLTRRGRALRKLATAHPVTGDVVESMCRRLLDGLEAARLRTRWRRLLDDLLSYWYWRGVAESLPGGPSSDLQRSPEPAPVLYELDLRQGLDGASHEIDSVQPRGLRLRWGSFVIGTVPHEPGAERLQGRHLRALLRRRFAARFAETLALAHAGCPESAAAGTPHGLSESPDSL